MLPFAERAKVAGAEKRQHLILVRGRIDRIAHPEASEAQAVQFAGVDLGSPEVERVLIEADLAHTLSRDFVDPDRLVEMPTRREEIHFERELVIAPQHPLRFVADLVIVFIVEVAQFRRQVRVGLFVRGVRQATGTLRDILKIECRG